jgi:lysophospholipase L1-like esterase
MQTYRILAIGDSVVWGQGVLDDHKFSALTRKNVEARLAQSQPGQHQVVLEVLAHSGAITTGISPAGTRMQGEIPWSYPSVQEQVSSLSTRPSRDDVRLIVMNGGANDVNIGEIISPSTTLDQIRLKTRKACYENMRDNVRRALSLCPNAEIILVGYYQALTEFSQLGPTDLEHFAINLFGVLKSPDILAALRTAIGDPTQSEVWKRAMIENGAAFQQAVDEAFSDLADSLNSELKFFGEQPRVHAVSSGFQPKNGAFCSPDSFIWGPNGAGFVSDEVVNPRMVEVDRLVASGVVIDKSLAYRASIGHPNVQGHQCFANSILPVLDGVLSRQGLAGA